MPVPTRLGVEALERRDTPASGVTYSDFGAAGLWQHTPASGWAKISRLDADMVVSNDGGALYGDFGTFGVWVHNAGTDWTQLSSVNADSIVTDVYGRLLADLGANGVWQWDGAAWAQIHPWDADALHPSPTGYLYADFGAKGVAHYASVGASVGSGAQYWQTISYADPAGLVVDSTGALVGDFGAFGVYRYTGTWAQVSAANPESLTASPDGSVYADFGAAGLWRYSNSGTWSKIGNLNADSLVVDAVGMVYADFAAAGLWRVGGTGNWEVLSGANAETMSVTPDGRLNADFGGGGVWQWNGAWSKLSAADATATGGARPQAAVVARTRTDAEGVKYLEVVGNDFANSITVSESIFRFNAKVFRVDGVKILDGAKVVEVVFTGGHADPRYVAVYGNGGNDVINVYLDYDTINFYQFSRGRVYGGDGDDLLTGGYGDDLLLGEGGNDTLNGGGAEDILQGGAGDDILIGGDADDGLYGGAGNDTLIGGAGNDRFWQIGGAEDSVGDLATGDVVLSLSQNNADSFTGTALAWADAEVLTLDRAAALIQLKAGGRAGMFENTVGALPFRLVKESALPDDGGYNWVRDINGQTVRTIHLADWDETSTPADLQAMRVFTHQLFRNFDSAAERVAAGLTAQSWDDFLALSGWTQTQPADMTGWSVSTDGQWYYRSDSAFADARGQANPAEDFATMGELYLHLWRVNGGPPGDRPDLLLKFNAVGWLLLNA
jgi:hypothetical protein